MSTAAGVFTVANLLDVLTFGLFAATFPVLVTVAEVNPVTTRLYLAGGILLVFLTRMCLVAIIVGLSANQRHARGILLTGALIATVGAASNTLALVQLVP